MQAGKYSVFKAQRNSFTARSYDENLCINIEWVVCLKYLHTIQTERRVKPLKFCASGRAYNQIEWTIPGQELHIPHQTWKATKVIERTTHVLLKGKWGGKPYQEKLSWYLKMWLISSRQHHAMLQGLVDGVAVPL